MGSPTNEQFRKDNEVQRKVTLTEAFWLADSEVPQDLWNAVMGTNRCRWNDDPKLPVENTSWNDGQAFCRKLNAAIPDLHITYPTEAQWEYACRAGSTAERYGPMTNISWWAGNARYRTHPVKQLTPNEWGLYDMLGNVQEWCLDWYAEYDGQVATNPAGLKGNGRSVRGGSCTQAAFGQRAAFRPGGDHPGGRYGNIGLRLCIPEGATVSSETAVREPIPKSPLLLWPEGAPGALGDTDEDKPSITAYVPEHPNGASMLIVPGGGYHILVDYEGRDYSEFLNQYGITCFVLKHRLGKRGGDPAKGYRHPIMMNDAARALRTIRTRSKSWGLDPDRVGMMGSSSGGHLTSTMMTHFDYGDPDAKDFIDRASSRPDLAVLCYPVIKIDQQKYSCLMLLGTNNPPQELVDDLSADKRIRPDSPPTFFLHTWEDDTVKMENSWDLAAALRKAGVPFEFHLFEKGKHGLSMCDKPPFKEAHPWAKDLIFWLEIRNFVNAEGTEP